MRKLKGYLGKNGDWLYVSLEGPCARCAGRLAPEYHDLDLDYESPDQAYQAFSAVSDEAGVELLLEHTKDYYNDVIETQRVVRDKAKLLLGATSFTIAVFALAATLLKDTLQGMNWWGMILILLPFVVVAVHFVRALVYALVAITRESTCAVSTQEFVDAVRAQGGAFDKVNVQRRLAALYRSVATRTNGMMTDRKATVMLAQGSFKWGLLLLPFLVVGYLLVVFLVGATSVPRWARPMEATIEKLEGGMNSIDPRVAKLEQGIAVLEQAMLEPRLRDTEQRVAAGAQDVKNLTVELQTLRGDTNALRDQVTAGRVDLAGELRALNERAAAVDMRLQDLGRRIQALTESADRKPEPAGDKK